MYKQSLLLRLDIRFKVKEGIYSIFLISAYYALYSPNKRVIVK
jgi:hypothetical protein